MNNDTKKEIEDVYNIERGFLTEEQVKELEDENGNC